MKKSLVLVLAMCVAAAMLLSACGESKDQATTAETTVADATEAASEAADAVDDAADAAEDAVEEAKDAAAETVDAAEDAVAEVADAAEDVVEEAKDAAAEAVDTAEDAVAEVADAAEDVVDEAKDAAAEAVDTAEDAVAEVADAAEDVVEEAKDAAEEAVDAAEDAVAEEADAAENVMEESINDTTATEEEPQAEAGEKDLTEQVEEALAVVVEEGKLDELIGDEEAEAVEAVSEDAAAAGTGYHSVIQDILNGIGKSAAEESEEAPAQETGNAQSVTAFGMKSADDAEVEAAEETTPSKNVFGLKSSQDNADSASGEAVESIVDEGNDAGTITAFVNSLIRDLLK